MDKMAERSDIKASKIDMVFLLLLMLLCPAVYLHFLQRGQQERRVFEKDGIITVE